MKNSIKGRGAQINTKNRYLSNSLDQNAEDGIDEYETSSPDTQIFTEHPKSILSKVDSPDVGMWYSLNPYQGCEHGCIYCYARNSHEYYGFSAGLDFESKIMAKPNAALLLEKEFHKTSWFPKPISLSGNTDCYQPIEKKLKITRSILGIMLKYGNPVSIISKNALILRDLDILQALAKDNLVHVYLSITTLQEELRQKLEPRTATIQKRFNTLAALTEAGIPVGVMAAPIIPGLNHSEIPGILKAASEAGALTAGYTVVRLNGAVGDLFHDWLKKQFPDRASKVWNQIRELHGGQVNDSRWQTRMSGEGPLASSINQLFQVAKEKYFADRTMPRLDTTRFRHHGSLRLF
jgi:DNA repair photolyase